MVRYKFKVPNLLELCIIIAAVIYGIIGYLLISRAINLGIMGLQEFFLYILTLQMFVIMAILEGIREKL